MAKKKKNQNHQKFHEVFSPTIFESKVPQRFLDIVNSIGDDVLKKHHKFKKGLLKRGSNNHMLSRLQDILTEFWKSMF